MAAAATASDDTAGRQCRGRLGGGGDGIARSRLHLLLTLPRPLPPPKVAPFCPRRSLHLEAISTLPSGADRRLIDEADEGHTSSSFLSTLRGARMASAFLTQRCAHCPTRLPKSSRGTHCSPRPLSLECRSLHTWQPKLRSIGLRQTRSAAACDTASVESASEASRCASRGDDGTPVKSLSTAFDASVSVPGWNASTPAADRPSVSPAGPPCSAASGATASARDGGRNGVVPRSTPASQASTPRNPRSPAEILQRRIAGNVSPLPMLPSSRPDSPVPVDVADMAMGWRREGGGEPLPRSSSAAAHHSSSVAAHRVGLTSAAAALLDSDTGGEGGFV